MNIVKPRILSGFMELSPADQLLFNSILETIRKSYELFGFAPVETPAIELSEILFAKGGGETEQEVYRFKRGDNDIALRYDLTVPTARYVAQYEADLPLPFRRYAIGKVWRAERAQAGRFREFYQCDIDIIGSDSVLYDAEVPSVIYATMRALGFTDFTIRINNRKILNGLFAELGAAEKSTLVMRIVDKLEKITEDGVRSQLAELGMSNESVDRLMSFLKITGTPDEILDGLRDLGIENPIFVEGVDELSTVVSAIRGFGVPEENFRLDLAIARGLDYYTGTVYETVLNEYPGVGSVCSGGRYDDLASYYTKTRLPGVGISIGLTRLFYKLREAGVIQSGAATPAKVLLCPVDKAGQDAAIKLSKELRDAGISTQVYLEAAKVVKQMRYANRLKVPYAIVIGETEATSGEYPLKDMTSGEMRSVDLKSLIEILS
ncbi:MAG: histidine--tRNA ligase [bacterium]